MDIQRTPNGQFDPAALLRLKQVLLLVPVAPSTWWLWVRDGRAPRPLKLGPRTTCWRASDILALIDRLAAVGEGEP